MFAHLAVVLLAATSALAQAPFPSTGGYQNTAPCWSPHGTSIVFASDRDGDSDTGDRP